MDGINEWSGEHKDPATLQRLEQHVLVVIKDESNRIVEPIFVCDRLE